MIGDCVICDSDYRDRYFEHVITDGVRHVDITITRICYYLTRVYRRASFLLFKLERYKNQVYQRLFIDYIEALGTLMQFVSFLNKDGWELDMFRGSGLSM